MCSTGEDLEIRDNACDQSVEMIRKSSRELTASLTIHTAHAHTLCTLSALLTLRVPCVC